MHKYLLIQILAKLLFLRKKLIVAIAKDHLGKDASPIDRVSDEVGCAESVTEILNKAITFPIITGTWTLNDYLQRDRRFSPAETPEPGDVIISPTGTSKKGKKAPFVGHTGIMGENGVIYNNNSYTGKWLATYTLETWKQRYAHEGGYPVYIYRLIE